MGFFDIFSDDSKSKSKTLENLSCICINEWNDGYTNTGDQKSLKETINKLKTNIKL